MVWCFRVITVDASPLRELCGRVGCVEHAGDFAAKMATKGVFGEGQEILGAFASFRAIVPVHSGIFPVVSHHAVRGLVNE